MSQADDIYKINAAKSEFREAFNTGDVERLLAVFHEEFADLSLGQPSFFGAEAREMLRWRMSELFSKFEARMAPIVIDIQVRGDVAFDYGWHKLTLTPKAGGAPVTSRQRYMEVWMKEASGRWRIAIYIDNQDMAPAFAPNLHWKELLEPYAAASGATA